MTICNQLEVFLVQYEFKRIDNIYLIYRGKCGLISKMSPKMAKKVAKSLSLAIKVSKCQNGFTKSSFLPKYELNIVRISPYTGKSLSEALI